MTQAPSRQAASTEAITAQATQPTKAVLPSMKDGLEHFGIGYSWGGFESLALPVDPQRYRSVTRRADAGPIVRLQIGLEDPADLIADLAAALARFAALR